MESAVEGDYLIVGLGNPGTKYERTRHNLGFLAVEALAQKWTLSFKSSLRLNGVLASGSLAGAKVHLLKPSTYMNLSGSAVARALNFYKIRVEHLLVIVDDVYVKFGAMRLRAGGSAGGHNGLKNIQALLGTSQYTRLRMGVGPLDDSDLPDGRERLLEDYVLANFTTREQSELPLVLERAVSVVETWLKLGVEPASQLAGEFGKTGQEITGNNRKGIDETKKTTL